VIIYDFRVDAYLDCEQSLSPGNNKTKENRGIARSLMRIKLNLVYQAYISEKPHGNRTTYKRSNNRTDAVWLRGSIPVRAQQPDTRGFHFRYPLT
jgi:hypothetical protein